MSNETGKPEDLVKTSEPGAIALSERELSDQELQQVAGGKGNKNPQPEKYLEYKLTDVLITSY